MCKTIFLLLTAVCLFAHVQAQSPGYLNALNTSGTTGTSGSTTYTYSVGEAVVFNNSCSYTPGVVQPTCVCMVVSVSEDFDLKHSARFFPNPTNSHVVIETDFPDFASFSITSLDGKALKTGKFDYNPVDLSGLPVGTYLLRLSTTDNQIFKTVKIIKQ
jgi:hypothetical protein